MIIMLLSPFFLYESGPWLSVLRETHGTSAADIPPVRVGLLASAGCKLTLSVLTATPVRLLYI